MYKCKSLYIYIFFELPSGHVLESPQLSRRVRYSERLFFHYDGYRRNVPCIELWKILAAGRSVAPKPIQNIISISKIQLSEIFSLE